MTTRPAGSMVIRLPLPVNLLDHAVVAAVDGDLGSGGGGEDGAGDGADHGGDSVGGDLGAEEVFRFILLHGHAVALG